MNPVTIAPVLDRCVLALRLSPDFLGNKKASIIDELIYKFPKLGEVLFRVVSFESVDQGARIDRVSGHGAVRPKKAWLRRLVRFP